MSGEGAVQQAHPRKTWSRRGEAAVVVWAGGDAREIVLHRSNRAVFSDSFVNCCADACGAQSAANPATRPLRCHSEPAKKSGLAARPSSLVREGLGPTPFQTHRLPTPRHPHAARPFPPPCPAAAGCRQSSQLPSASAAVCGGDRPVCEVGRTWCVLPTIRAPPHGADQGSAPLPGTKPSR